MNDRRIRVILGNSSLASYPEGGGHWTCFLQHLLGLQALGHEVFFLELFRSNGSKEEDDRLISTFFRKMGEYGVADRCLLLVHSREEKHLGLETAQAYGRSIGEVEEICRSADLLWNYCASLRQPLLSLFRQRVFIDLDPGHLQVSALEWDLGLHDHDRFLTVGSKVHHPDCQVPTLGLTWHSFRPFVYLPLWDVTPVPPMDAPFTSVTQWNWEEVWLNGRVLSTSKRDAYLRYVELPPRIGHRCELAANIHATDPTRDRDLLQAHGWKIADPHVVAGSPSLYRAYIQSSRGEISCAKPIFRELKTGWFSDRSVCYLASGRPVLAEDTGWSDDLPVGHGLLPFRDIDEAVAGAAEIAAHYSSHMQAAREIAEAYFDSHKCLEGMLSASG